MTIIHAHSLSSTYFLFRENGDEIMFTYDEFNKMLKSNKKVSAEEFHSVVKYIEENKL